MPNRSPTSRSRAPASSGRFGSGQFPRAHEHMRREVEDLVRRHPALGLIGKTPLIPIRVFREGLPRVNVFAKVEATNPGGSIKDRPVLYMLANALARGEIRP